MFFEIRDMSFIYLLLFPSASVILGGLALHWVEQTVDEPIITDIEDAFCLAITTKSTVGYGETYPATTEGRIIVATVLVFAGILTFYGFLSTVSSKIIMPTFEVKPKGKKEGKDLRRKDDDQSANENDKEKEWLKEQIDHLERLDKNDFADLILR